MSNNNKLDKNFVGLNLVIAKTFDVFDQYGISTRNINVKLQFSVIDLDKWEIVESFITKRDAIEYVTQLTNRVHTHRKIDSDQYH